MKKLMQELSARLTAGENVVMVTVVTRSGSAPRGAGARMLVNAAGRLGGTVGGGAVEHRAEETAMRVLAEEKGFMREFSLSAEEIAGLGMVCGGAVRLCFQYFRGGDEAAAAQAREIIRLLDEGEEAWLVITLTGEDGGRMETVSPESDPALCAKLDALPKGRTLFENENGQTCYAERLNWSGRYMCSAADMSRRSWCRCSVTWGSDALSWTTVRSLQAARCFPTRIKSFLRSLAKHLDTSPYAPETTPWS